MKTFIECKTREQIKILFFPVEKLLKLLSNSLQGELKLLSNSLQGEYVQMGDAKDLEPTGKMNVTQSR